MSDGAIRFVVLAGLVALVAIVTWLLRRRAVRVGPVVIPPDLGPFPAVFYFGDEDCVSCKPTAAAIAEAGLRVRTISWGMDAVVFERLQVDEVPTLWGVDRRGRLVRVVTGVPGPRDLARLKSQQSPE
ncbi:MAG: hypothetical protein OEO77_02420 [Acidimicrobiia bacterium]|nr:hypothetical protein [Acidimicrobiia bacterium]